MMMTVMMMMTMMTSLSQTHSIVAGVDSETSAALTLYCHMTSCFLLTSSAP